MQTLLDKSAKTGATTTVEGDSVKSKSESDAGANVLDRNLNKDKPGAFQKLVERPHGE